MATGTVKFFNSQKASASFSKTVADPTYSSMYPQLNALECADWLRARN